MPKEIPLPGELGNPPKPDISSDNPTEIPVKKQPPQPKTIPTSTPAPLAINTPPEEEPQQPISPFLRTLYIQEQGSILRKSNNRFLVYKDEQILADLPAFKIQQIMVLGHCAVTLPALVYCLEKAIPITYLSGTGKYYGRTSAAERGNLELLQTQLFLSQDTEFRQAVSRQIVMGKLQNTRELLRRVNRYREHPALTKARDEINRLLEKMPAAATLDSLRGLEGAGAAAYFSSLEEILPPHWGFHGRKRQPPPDPFNSLLSFGYTILFYNLYSLAEMRGLHTAAGFLHDRRSGHPALVSDLMEEWRAPIVDALAIKMALNSELSPVDDFQLPAAPGQPCLLGESARKKWLDGLEKKFHTLISHPLFEEQVNLRRAAQIQVERLAWSILKGQPDYEPYLWR
jgi:CRISPR-associated endonuclease Cas1